MKGLVDLRTGWARARTVVDRAQPQKEPRRFVDRRRVVEPKELTKATILNGNRYKDLEWMRRIGALKEVESFI